MRLMLLIALHGWFRLHAWLIIITYTCTVYLKITCMKVTRSCKMFQVEQISEFVQVVWMFFEWVFSLMCICVFFVLSKHAYYLLLICESHKKTLHNANSDHTFHLRYVSTIIFNFLRGPYILVNYRTIALLAFTNCIWFRGNVFNILSFGNAKGWQDVIYTYNVDIH